MTQREKLSKRLSGRQPEFAFADVRLLLEQHGWSLERQRGSHATFTKPGKQPIGLPILGGRWVKRPYVSLVVGRIGEEYGVMRRRPLSTYLKIPYPFRAEVDADAGYVVHFPDLPGCYTGADTLEELPAMIAEARSLWIETAYADGHDIPAPTQFDHDAYSGKFNLRLPRSLHQALADASEEAGVSLNQYVATLLARGDAQARLERRMDEMTAALRAEGVSLSGHTRVADAPGEYRTEAPARPRTKRRGKAGSTNEGAS